MMKLLLDQGTPRSAASRLRQAGLEAVHTGECGLAEASDAEIIQRAAEQDRIVVTLDADFHALLALSASRTSASASKVCALRNSAGCYIGCWDSAPRSWLTAR